MHDEESAARWITSFVRLLVEVEGGVRPVRHIRPMLSPELQLSLGRAGRRGRMPRVGKVLVVPAVGAWDAVVLLHEGERVTALALHVVSRSGGWQVTVMRRPGEAPAPQPEDPEEEDPMRLVQRSWHELHRRHRAPQHWALPQGWCRPALPTADEAA